MMFHRMKATSSSALKRGKSLGDSIKNHIFNKALAAKTINPIQNQTSKDEVHVSYLDLVDDSDSSLLDSPTKSRVKYIRLE